MNENVYLVCILFLFVSSWHYIHEILVLFVYQPEETTQFTLLGSCGWKSMENESLLHQKLSLFGVNPKKEERHSDNKTTSSAVTIRGVLTSLKENLNEKDKRPVIHLGHGDPSAFPCFRTSTVAEDAVVDALRTAHYNCYSPTLGVPSARR